MGWTWIPGSRLAASTQRNLEDRVPAFGNVTLLDGETFSLGRYMGKDDSGVPFGFDILEDGTHVSFNIIVSTEVK